MKKIVAIAISAMLLVLCLAVTAGAAEVVYYENDFSDASTLSDFTQYRGEWGIVDGKLMMTGMGELAMDEQGWIIFTKDPHIMNLTDYMIEVDMCNLATQGGPIFRCDINNLVPDKNAGFTGYQAFVSYAATQGVIGHADIFGNWGGNFTNSDPVMGVGSNVRITATAFGSTLLVNFTDIDTGADLWTGSAEDTDFAYGSFGFRLAVMKDGVTNIYTTGFDNLKVTALGDVGDHLAAGGTLETFKPSVTSAVEDYEITEAIDVTVPEVVEVDVNTLDMTVTDYVFYENDFSDAATISDFTTYCGRWAIKDGMLYYNELAKGYESAGNISFILYSGNHDANLLTDYTVEMDVINSQTACGPISRADLSQANSISGNAFYGYLTYISSTGVQPALGASTAEGGWAGVLAKGEPDTLTPGSNYHISMTHFGTEYSITFSTTEGDVIWNYTGNDTKFAQGTFGIRCISSKDLLVSLGNTGFDNMKVTVHGDQAALLAAGYHPNAVITGREEPVETTEAPVETTEAPVEATEPVDATADPVVTDEPEQTTAPATTTPAEEGGAPVALIVGIIAAVVVIAVVVVVILKKKKN